MSTDTTRDVPTRRLRAALLAGCVLAAAIAAVVAQPEPHLLADPELARLLRGMALIKAMIVLVGVALLLWRFGRPVPARIAAVYIAGTWIAAGASMLIWQLALIPYAAAAFHLGEFAVLVAAWRDMPRRGARAAPQAGPSTITRLPSELLSRSGRTF